MASKNGGGVAICKQHDLHNSPLLITFFTVSLDDLTKKRCGVGIMESLEMI